MTADAYGNLSGKNLVIFGCGYLGGEIARQAVARGVNVTALTRNAAKAAMLRSQGVGAVVAELGAETWHERIPGGAEFVLDCVSSGGGGVGSYRRSHVGGMRSILAWARRRPAGTVVYTGSTSVYPQGGGVVVDEAASTEGAGETARVLLEAEALLREGGNTRPARPGKAADSGLGHPGQVADRPGTGETDGPAIRPCHRWFILRLAGIYGPGRHRLLDQVRAGEVGGRAQDHLNLVHRDDICAAIWAAFAAPAEKRDEVFNVADDAAATREEIAGWLASRLGVPPPRFSAAPAAGRRALTPDRIIGNARLKRVLGWRPAFPSFREGYAAILGGQERD